MQRMARAGIPPPCRDDERYGPLAQNSEGDEAFRKDRRAWYAHVTGESFKGVSLTEQWQRVDVLARGWRAYSDGRSVKQQPQQEQPQQPHAQQPAQQSGPKCIECGYNPCECDPPGSDEETSPVYL